MHKSLSVALGAAALVASAGLAFLPAAEAKGSGPAASRSGHPVGTVNPSGATRPLCYTNTTGDTGTAVVSQNFEPEFDPYDTLAADNVTLHRVCRVTSIDLVGTYFNGSGPADSENVTFFADDHGQPGAVVNSQTVVGDDSAGSFTIPLAKVTLAPGRYWVAVQANMSFASGGEWGWEATSNIKGKPAVWENPGGGFGAGCTSWGDLGSCLGLGQPIDLIFQLHH